VIGALEQQRQFVDHASHQLRNPLAALRLRIENIQLEASRNPAGDFGAPEQIQLALEESDRLTAILDGLLALASAERGRFRPEPCEVGSLVNARLDVLRPLAQRHGVTLVRSGQEAQEALAIPGTVEQAVDELVGNACKFAGDGATVTVHLAERDGLAELHVVDDGPGLEEGELEQASTRFWRSRAHQNVDGSGLGLAILSVLAEASGGDVTLQRAHPTGLDVRLRLPLVADAAGKEGSDAQRPDGDAHPRGRGGDADGSGGAPHGTPAGGRADGQTLVSR
jgi:signal transduction histidine kinase